MYTLSRYSITSITNNPHPLPHEYVPFFHHERKCSESQQKANLIFSYSLPNHLVADGVKINTISSAIWITTSLVPSRSLPLCLSVSLSLSLYLYLSDVEYLNTKT